jgi:hypothetical protein
LRLSSSRLTIHIYIYHCHPQLLVLLRTTKTVVISTEAAHSSIVCCGVEKSASLPEPQPASTAPLHLLLLLFLPSPLLFLFVIPERDLRLSLPLLPVAGLSKPASETSRNRSAERQSTARRAK